MITSLVMAGRDASALWRTDNASPSDYAGLVLPGGVANPDFLRMSSSAVNFIKGFVRRGPPGPR
jgi:putative intracellular protease/amidase